MKQTKFIIIGTHPDNWEQGFYPVEELNTLEEATEKFNEYIREENPPERYYLVEVEKENIADTIHPNDVAEWIQEEWSEETVENTSEIIERKINELKAEIEKLGELTYWPVKVHESFEKE